MDMTGKTPMTKPETRVAPYTNNMCTFSTILFFFSSGRNKNDEGIKKKFVALAAKANPANKNIKCILFLFIKVCTTAANHNVTNKKLVVSAEIETPK